MSVVKIGCHSLCRAFLYAGRCCARHGTHSEEVGIIGQLNKDEWNGFANLMANLIEKYAAILDIDNLPDKREDYFLEESKLNLESEKVA